MSAGETSGARLGPYVLEALIGRGGMGAVHRARHVETGARHAVKVIEVATAAGALSPRRTARFEREVELLARIDAHPNVVRVHACGLTPGGRAWCAMDWVEGEPLSARLERGPLAPREAARLLAAVARAVHHVHAHGVVHRDLKPDNVLLDEAGEPRIVDFGIAYDAFAEALTRTGELVGTPAFMAPEQVRRESGSAAAGEDSSDRVDAATDVYGLGATLYAALTAETPFDAPNAFALVGMIVHAPPVRPRARVPDLPPALEAVCLRALHKQPVDRYADAAAFADDLERWLRGEPVSASARGAGSRLLSGLRVPRSRGARIAAGALVASILVASGALALHAAGLLERASASERLAALEDAFERGRGGPLDADGRARLAALEDAVAATGDAALERRRACLAALDGIVATDPGSPEERARAEALAGLLRPGGVPDRSLILRAVERLDRRARAVAIDRILHGAEPAEAAPFGVAAVLARLMAADEAPIAPPTDAAAFDVIARAPGLDGATVGRLHTRRAERLIEAGAVDEAVEALRIAWAEHGRLPERPPPPSFAAALHEAFARALADEDVPRASALGDLTVRIWAGDEPVAPALVARLQRFAGLRDMIDGLSRTGWPRRIEAGGFVYAHGLMPLEPERLYREEREAQGLERLLDIAEQETRRPPARRHVGRLLLLAAVLRDTRFRDRTAGLMHAVVETGVEGAWIHATVGRTFDQLGDGHAARAALERAVQLDRARPEALRRPEILASLSAVLLAPELGVADPERAYGLLVEAAETQVACHPTAEALVAVGAGAPWPMNRAANIVMAIRQAAASMIDRPAPRCCAGDGLLEKLVAAGLRCAPLPDANVGHDATRASYQEGFLYAARGRHHERHGRAEAALADLDVALARFRSYTPRREERQLDHDFALAAALASRGRALRALGRAQEADRDREEATALREAARARQR